MIELKKIFLFAIALAFLLPAIGAKAASVGDVVTFNVDPNFDAIGAAQVSATLVKVTPSLYFYLPTDWWNAKSPAAQSAIMTNISTLSDEFANKIYPTLTGVFGSEWNPGIDRDNKITVLFEPMKNSDGGYFRQNDEYQKIQIPDSNQREMVYLSTDYAQNTAQLKVIMAHELMHLIIFNQKNRLQNAEEETWLDEARSDYTSTLLGYDDDYVGSNLQSRVQDFLRNPSDSLTEFTNTKSDFASVNIFMHYLVDHYGVGILADSLHSKLVGIPSINEALAKNGAAENFSQVFTNWTIATTINDCSSNANYCYTDTNLSELKINPGLIFLPLIGDSSLTMNDATKNWAGNWQKIIGGNGDLSLQFSAAPGLVFRMPYILYDKSNNYTVNFLTINSQGKGTLTVKNFGTNANSLVIVPSLQSKLLGFTGVEPQQPYTLVVSITGSGVPQPPPVVVPPPTTQGCALNNNLYLGLSNSDVKCLQQFLVAQGPQIYPEGLVTGFFGNLTRAAVIRFQKKYSISPAVGFVGPLTRAKINSLGQAH